MEQLDKIEIKVDKILEIQGEMKVVQAEQHLTLEDHTRRSTAAEANLATLKEELKPVFALKEKVEFTVKIVMYIVGLIVSSGIIKVVISKMLS